MNKLLEFRLPSKNGESDREHEGLNTDTRAEGVEGGVVRVAVPRLGDREPGVLRVELHQVQGPPDRAAERG